MQRRRTLGIDDSSIVVDPTDSPPSEFGVKSIESNASSSTDQQPQPSPPRPSSSTPTPPQNKNRKHRQARYNPLRKHRSDQPATDQSSLVGRSMAPHSPSPIAWSISEDPAWDDHSMDFVVPRMSIRERNRPSMTVLRDHDIGHLRIMVCGDSGVGKSALIRALCMLPEVSVCDTAQDHDQSIHHDTATVQSTLDGFEQVCLGDEDLDQSSVITETLACSKHPTKWDAHKDAHHHPKNLCFIDTPGYGAFLDANTVIAPVTQYLVSQFKRSHRMLHPDYPNGEDLVRLFNNKHGGHTHVDVCLYLIMGRLKKVDLEYLRSIHRVSNVVPVIVKSDLISTEQEKELKMDVLRELRDQHIDYFDFGYTHDELINLVNRRDPFVPPFAISSLSPLPSNHMFTSSSSGASVSIGGGDDDISKEPVLSSSRTTNARKSRLNYLKDAMFYEQAERLRHSTAAKFAEWRAQISTRSSPPPTVLSPYGIADDDDGFSSITQRTRQLDSVHMSRYLNESRKSLERTLQEKEHHLRQMLESVDRRRRAELVSAELSKLIQEGVFDAPAVTSSTSTLDSSASRKARGSPNRSRTLVIPPRIALVKQNILDIRIFVTMILAAVALAALGVYIFTHLAKAGHTPSRRSPR